MRVRILHVAWVALPTVTAVALAVSCAASDAASGTVVLPPIDAGPTDAATDRADIDVPLPDSGADTGADAGPSALCGSGACFPDDTASCTPLLPDAGEAGSDDAGAEAGESVYGCRVIASGRIVTQECALAGEGRFDAPCLSSANCAPGYACAGEGSGGLCRPFCCAGSSACEDGLFCTELPLVHPYASGETPVVIPVCAFPDQCNLSQPYPCPEELQAASQCTCPAGKACVLVTENGTSCVEPGTGLAGEPCPCDWGHVCSQGTQKCLKLCSTSNLDPECGSGRCMTFNGLPSGWGVCAGLDADGG